MKILKTSELIRLRKRVKLLKKVVKDREDNVLIVQGGLKAIWNNKKDDLWSTL